MRFLYIICGLLAISGTVISTDPEGPLSFEAVPAKLKLGAQTVLRMNLPPGKREEIRQLIGLIDTGKDFTQRLIDQEHLKTLLEPFLEHLEQEEKRLKSEERLRALDVESEKLISKKLGKEKTETVKKIVLTYLREGSGKAEESKAFKNAMSDLNSIEREYGLGIRRTVHQMSKGMMNIMGGRTRHHHAAADDI